MLEALLVVGTICIIIDVYIRFIQSMKKYMKDW